MRVLLDESLPHDFRILIPSHDIFTVQHQGWSGKKNGELLALAATEFDVFVTTDRNLRFQQNLADLALGIVVLVAHPNRVRELRPLIPELLEAIESVGDGEVVVVGS